MVSQFLTNDNKQRRKRFIGELANFPDGLMAVGRLDEDSEGLLLLTTNGKLSHTINKSKAWEKEYAVQVDGIITTAAIAALQKGIEIGINGKKYMTQPCHVQLLNTPDYLYPTNQRLRDDRHGPTSWITITLTEGKFRQVRKMTSAAGFPTLRLARVRIGMFTIDTLKGASHVEIDSTVFEKIKKTIL